MNQTQHYHDLFPQTGKEIRPSTYYLSKITATDVSSRKLDLADGQRKMASS
jgi:hypothetical protein